MENVLVGDIVEVESLDFSIAKDCLEVFKDLIGQRLEVVRVTPVGVYLKDIGVVFDKRDLKAYKCVKYNSKKQ